MKVFLLSLIITSLVSQVAFGDCTKPVTYLTSGTPAPCTGYLHTPDQQTSDIQISEQYKLTNQQLTYITQALDLKNKEVSDLNTAYSESQKEVNIWKTEAENQASKNQNLLKDQTTNHLLWFGGGVLLTIALTFAVSGALKNSANK